MLNDIYEELLEKLYSNNDKIMWEEYKSTILLYIKKGSQEAFAKLPCIDDNKIIRELFISYRKYYYNKHYFKYPKWDKVCITTLFTFYWDITIDTINFVKKICKSPNDVMVGGIMASLLHDYVEKETGIKPYIGALNKPGILDDNDIIIDTLPLDYSILDEVDYKYPANNAYFAYMTRGCVNKCSFCAVPRLEPEYKNFIGLKEQIELTNNRFGEKKDLLLLDNNVLASCRFDEIIDEIKDCGFAKNNKFVPPNKFEIAIQNLRNGYNDKAYIREIVDQYKILVNKFESKEIQDIYNLLDEKKVLNIDTANKENILFCYDDVKDVFAKLYNTKPRKRIVDFNQGVDARLITDDNMKKLSEIAIEPLRIAFDSWKLKDIYENAVILAAKNGIKNLSNYLLYNHKEKPIDLYRRLKLNIELCDRLNVNIYSFPMKYHPIEDPQYFRNRDFIGPYWNRKFIRAIQAILNSTKGKVGKGREFFEEAFGKDEEEFYKLLYMPEAFIIYRRHFKHNGLTGMWWEDFKSLPLEKGLILKKIVEENKFKEIESLTEDKEIYNVLEYYTITREDAERKIKEAE
ncbi:hypothetical protein [Alkaliphilus sp. B6464]|uniref:hypothetical protein n=1 Tax=Alkaliphilus sp. B6464 TaxID=2731219 RepID=UPI001BAE325D|nr:hypothetical protein [Alkaliphilus sp. B6464]QUH20407.1 hypothetical protein HYG84_11200 [Alkaliphilus sp. B6464]